MGKLTNKLKGLNKKSQGILGFITVACGLSMLLGSTLGRNQGNSKISAVAAVAVDIDSNRPTALHNGKVVVASGVISSAETLEDEFLRPDKYLVLIRHVEMFQWIEEEPSRGGPAVYSLDWHEGQLDFFTFQTPKGHENPLLKYTAAKKVVSSAAFGKFDARKILEAIEKPPLLELTPAMLKDPTSKIANGKIVLAQDPSKTGVALGDIRIWYEAVMQGPYTVAGRQQDEMTLLGRSPSGWVLIKPGTFSASELFDDLSDESDSTFSGLIYIGGLVLFFGIFSVLARLVPKMDLRPRLEVKGIPAVALVSAGLTLVVMGIFYLLGLVT